MIDYAAILAETKAMIKEVGVSITLIRITPGAYNPSTGQTGADIQVRLKSYGVASQYSVGAIDGEIVKVGDRRMILPGDLLYAPEPGDQIIMPDGTWTIPMDSPGAVIPTMPGGVVTKYEVRTRK